MCDDCGKDAYGAADGVAELCDPCAAKPEYQPFFLYGEPDLSMLVARPGKGIPIPAGENGLIFKSNIMFDVQPYLNEMYRQLAISQQRAIERVIIGSTEV